MNNKIIIGVVLAVIVLTGAFLLVSNQSKMQNKTATSTPTVTHTNPVVQTSPTATDGAKGINRERVTVTLTNSGFTPATVSVKAGSVVTLINKSGSVATVNSDPHPTHRNYPPINLGEFSDGTSVQLTFDTPGTFTYHNHLNPSFTGTVVVE